MKHLIKIATVGFALTAGQALADDAFDAAVESGFCDDRGGVATARWKDATKSTVEVRCKQGGVALDDRTVAIGGLTAIAVLALIAGDDDGGSASGTTGTTGTD